MNKKNILIVGQGIAGTVLAHSLYKRSINFTIIDNNHHNAASLAAAGMYTPVVLKRLVKSWEIDILLPFAVDFYQSLERLLNIQIISPQVNYRKIAQDSEYQDWLKKHKTSLFQDYIGDIVDPDKVNGHLVAPLGFGAVKNAGTLEVGDMLRESRKYFADRLVNDKLDHDDLKCSGDVVQYCGVSYTEVVFCEGYQVKDNPFFQDIEMKPVKGENIIVKIPNFNLSYVIKSSVYIRPMGDDLYHVGSTYDWKNLNGEPTEEAKQMLLQKLRTLVNLPVQVVDHKAGVRPSSKDRRPILGQSPTNKNVYILNGMGAKGLMLAPYFSNQLCDLILKEIPLNSVVNSDRFVGE